PRARPTTSHSRVARLARAASGYRRIRARAPVGHRQARPRARDPVGWAGGIGADPPRRDARPGQPPAPRAGDRVDPPAVALNTGPQTHTDGMSGRFILDAPLVGAKISPPEERSKA